MDQKIKALWIDALRSGNYKQGETYLNADGKFCCLGVLCEIAIEQGVEVTKDVVTEDLTRYGGHYAGLPNEVRDWSGVSSLGDLPERVGYHDSLASLNDNGYSFKKIANIIEEKL
jgi:hypothetical protein